jgi:hypothetical protein
MGDSDLDKMETEGLRVTVSTQYSVNDGKKQSGGGKGRFRETGDA